MRFLKWRRTRTLERREAVLHDIDINKRATHKEQGESDKIKQILHRRYNKKNFWIKLK